MSRASRAARWVSENKLRAYLVCFLAAIVPPAVFGYFTSGMMREQAERQSRAETEQVAALSATLVADYFRQQIAFLETYARRQRLHDAWLRRDLAGVRRHLQEAAELQPEVEHFSLNEPDGTLRVVHPHDPEVVGSNFSFRPWYQDLARTWQPHVSEAFESVIGGRKLVVVVAVPLRGEGGAPVGILVARYPVERLLAHFGGVRQEGPFRLVVLDQEGRLVISSDLALHRDPSTLAAYLPMLRSREGKAATVHHDGEDIIAAHAYIPKLGWAVVAEQPASLLYGALAAMRSQVFGLGLLFALLATLAGAALISLYGNLQRSEERFAVAVQGSHGGIWDWDLRSNRVFISAPWKKQLGYGGAEVESFEFWAGCLHPDERERVMHAISGYLEGRTADFEVEHRMRAADGSYRWILTRGACLRDPGGKPYRFAGSHTDITERKAAQDRLREATAEISDLYENAPCGYHSLDQDGLILRMNQTELHWLGYKHEEVVGRMNILQVVDQAGARTFRENYPVLMERGYVRELEFTMVRKDGTTFPAILSATAIHDTQGNFVMTRSTLFDISERKQAEDRLRESEQRYRLLSEELAQRNREVQRATDLKSQFLANMSHELRTPLNAILGFSEMLELRVPGPLTEKQERYVQRIRQGGNHLLQLINDILDLAKIEAGHLELKREMLSPAALVPEVLSVIRPLAMAKNIRLTSVLDGSVRIHADRVRLKQVLFNLLSNAVKFTPEKGEVGVRIRVEERFAALSVSDNGVGIRAADLAAIFEEFRQVGESAAGVPEGTGLGLAITRRIVEQHGGRVSVESVPGQGSRFTVHLPLAEPGEPAPAPAPLPEAVHQGNGSPHLPLVLIVDDDPASCDLLADYLEPEGYRIARAHSGSEAVEMAQRLRPAVITLDILMPDGNGFGTLYQLRNTPETATIPVVVVSVVDRAHVGLALGAVEYLVKPVDRSALLRAVERHLGRVQGQLGILVVDDDPEVLMLASEALQSHGYRVQVAGSGDEALRILESLSFRAILLDLVMPGMDGFEVLRRLRERPALRDVPVFVLTAKDLTPAELELLQRETRALLRKGSGWKRDLLLHLRRHVTATGEVAKEPA